MFRRFADWWINAVGHPMAFTIAVALCVIWLASGPLFDFSDTWQLIINTFTTVVTWIMLFLIQSSQNRDTRAMQAKLDLILHEIEEIDETKLAQVLEEGGDRVDN